MNERDELIAAIEGYKQSRAILGNVDDGNEEFEKAERRRAEQLPDAELRSELDAALEEWQTYDRMQRKLKIFRSVFSDRISWLLAGDGEGRNKLAKLAPPVLTNALERMEREIEFRRGIGIEQIYFSQAPGSSGLTSSRKRTSADELATTRAEQALAKLQKLIYVAGDPTENIRAIIGELREADLNCVWDQPERKPEREPLVKPGNARRFAVAISDQVAAEIEPE